MKKAGFYVMVIVNTAVIRSKVNRFFFHFVSFSFTVRISRFYIVQLTKNMMCRVYCTCTCLIQFFLFYVYYLFADNGFYTQNGSSTANTKMNKEQPSTMNMSSHEKYEAKKSIAILIGIFLLSLSAMFYVYLKFPELEE